MCSQKMNLRRLHMRFPLASLASAPAIPLGPRTFAYLSVNSSFLALGFKPKKPSFSCFVRVLYYRPLAHLPNVATYVAPQSISMLMMIICSKHIKIRRPRTVNKQMWELALNARTVHATMTMRWMMCNWNANNECGWECAANDAGACLIQND
jgi:hypothetical protein